MTNSSYIKPAGRQLLVTLVRHKMEREEKVELKNQEGKLQSWKREVING